VDKRPNLAKLFEEHELRVFAYLRHVGADRETAADLTQETFVRALGAAHRFRGEGSVTTWLVGIARHVFFESLRKQRGPEVHDAPTPDLDPSASDALDVERALARVAPEHREVLVLRIVLDLSGEDAAAILGVSHDVVRQRLTRAKEAFRKEWDR
jgi:RNA polymerase sigma-70 factor (ECF subfamily)